MEVAVFGGGCFWCTEAVYKMLKGVKVVEPGYAGGTVKNPSYEAVCSGSTGHAEVIRITYDHTQISYGDLLTVFFASHDPTTLNRQGNDVGPQYRSIILYTNDEQKSAAEKFIEQIQKDIKDGTRIVTEVQPLQDFFPAEDYHKDYFARNTTAPYCELIIEPKLAKVQKQFEVLLKEKSI